MNTKLNFGEEVVIEVKFHSNLLPALYPNAKTTDTYHGVLQRRAPYDEKDSVRLICKDGPMKVRVIQFKNILKLNHQQFYYTPTPVLRAKTDKKTVEVTGSSGNKYTLTILDDGRVMCHCKGFGFHGKCQHVEDYLKKHGE